MKICRVFIGNESRLGVREDETIDLFDRAVGLEHLTSPPEFPEFVDSVKVAEAVFLPPAAPSKIVCVGRNYAEHAAELGNEIPAEPLLFFKAPSSIITNGEEIIIPLQSERVEHEGELAVIIGKQCKGIGPETDPMNYVLGFTCLNDVTARDLQKKDGQFARAKSFDTFCPVGRYIETDLDHRDVRVTTRVNGQLKQDGRTSQMVFDIPFLILYISNQMTLIPGDIIATGTPAGVSQIRHGDSVVVEIEGIGTLENSVINLRNK